MHLEYYWFHTKTSNLQKSQWIYCSITRVCVYVHVMLRLVNEQLRLFLWLSHQQQDIEGF